MLIKSGDLKHRKFRVCDADGLRIPLVRSFNTKTCELELYIGVEDSNGLMKSVVEMMGGQRVPHLIKTQIPGSYAVDAHGKRIRE